MGFMPISRKGLSWEKNMKQNTTLSARERFDLAVSKKARRFNRKLDKAGQVEVDKVAIAFVKHMLFQLKIRPRLKLILKVLPLLFITFLVTNKAVAYLEPKKAEIKINGEAVLVAEGNADAKSLDEVEISQSVSSKLSPFEFVMPVESGQISQGYTSYHRAFDIATRLGTPIRPVGAGKIEFAGYIADGKGNTVIIDHGDGLKTVYAHMGKIYAGVGNMVDTKTVIGTIGLTGRTTGPHVHFELYDNNVAVNPGNLLPQ